MKIYTEEELEFLNRAELIATLHEAATKMNIALEKLVPKKASLSLLRDTILEIQEEKSGS